MEKNIQGCCPMFENDDVVIEKFLSEEEDQVIWGNCLINENAYVDCRNLTVHGNLTLGFNAEMYCLGLEVFGNVILNDGSKIIIEGDDNPLVHGKISGPGKLIFD